MKCYGDSWNLPGVNDLPNPFIGLYVNEGVNPGVPSWQNDEIAGTSKRQEQGPTPENTLARQTPGTSAASMPAPPVTPALHSKNDKVTPTKTP